MNIQVNSGNKVIENRHYIGEPIKETQPKQRSDDITKLLNLRRNLVVKPAELQLMSLCKDNRLMKRVLLQVKQICLEEQDPQIKIEQIASLLAKY